jgi:hypothetical protein
MSSIKTCPDRPAELENMLRGMYQSVQQLVELGESVLDMLERSDATHDVVAGKAPSSGSRSVRSENGTSEGAADLLQEDIITFAEARKMIPTDPPPSVSTISRWCTSGTGDVKLESTYIGGRRKTSRQAVERFLRNCREVRWKGIHANTAHALEQALAAKDQLGQQRDYGEAHSGHAHPGWQQIIE